jgi:hypothetical protein
VRTEGVDVDDDGVRERRRPFDLGMVDGHLAGVGSRSLGVRVGEVGGRVRERGSNGAELSAEAIEYRLRSRFRPADVVVQQDEGDVVPVPLRSPGVRGGAPCEEESGGPPLCWRAEGRSRALVEGMIGWQPVRSVHQMPRKTR